MQCERCQKNPARVRVDQVVNGQREAHYLCQSCVDELMSTFSQPEELTKKIEEISRPASEAIQSQEQNPRNTSQQLQAMNDHLNALDERLHQIQATCDEQKTLLAQILARLPENPSQQ